MLTLLPIFYLKVLTEKRHGAGVDPSIEIADNISALNLSAFAELIHYLLEIQAVCFAQYWHLDFPGFWSISRIQPTSSLSSATRTAAPTKPDHFVKKTITTK